MIELSTGRGKPLGKSWVGCYGGHLFHAWGWMEGGGQGVAKLTENDRGGVEECENFLPACFLFDCLAQSYHRDVYLVFH